MENNMDRISVTKYVVAFFITAFVFGGAIVLSNYFNNRRVAEIKSIQDRIAVDILSSETQFDLLTESSCKSLDESVLSQELNSLSSRLSYMEETLGTDDIQVQEIKRYYSLLQIKDFLLMQRLAEKCKIQPISILYFYSNKGECTDCTKVGYVLTYMREEYPRLRVYAFDYNMEDSAIKTLQSIYKLNGTLPALVIDDKAYYGFKSVEDILEIAPDIKNLEATSTNATSTAATTTKR
jgi:hypothetical protein